MPNFHTLRLIDLASREVVHQETIGGIAYDAQFDQTGDEIAVGLSTGNIVIYSYETLRDAPSGAPSPYARASEDTQDERGEEEGEQDDDS